ncbi:hypothetical protein VPHD260_0180 [Vibrio phage D260]
MKKSQLAEVLESHQYHVNERPLSMTVWQHGDYVCYIGRCELNGKYRATPDLPNRIRAIVETYGDM